MNIGCMMLSNPFNELLKYTFDELLQRPRQVPNSIGTSNIAKADSNVKRGDERGAVKNAGKGGRKGVVSLGAKPAITNAPVSDIGGISGRDNEQQRDVSDVGRGSGQETQEVVIGKLRGERGVSGVSGQNSIRSIENEKLPYQQVKCRR
jgi:hypothetical protein